MPETEWLQHIVHKHLDDAFEAVMGPYRGPAVVTKVLHIKRPRLIPVCDSYVARTMGVELSGQRRTCSSWSCIYAGRARRTWRRCSRYRLGSTRSASSAPSCASSTRLLWMRGNERGEYVVFEQWLHEVYD